LRGVEREQPVRLSWLVQKRLNVWLWCEACSHHASLPVPPIMARHGDITLGELRRKSRCSKCRSQQVFVRPDWPKRGVVSRHDRLPD